VEDSPGSRPGTGPAPRCRSSSCARTWPHRRSTSPSALSGC